MSDFTAEQWQDYKQRQRADIEAHKLGKHIWYGKVPHSYPGAYTLAPMFQGTAYAVRNGKLNKKSGRRLATKYKH